MTQLVHARLPCGWCGTTNTDMARVNCINCGGPLPPAQALAADDPGSPPPLVPRKLPSKYRWRIMLWKNVQVTIGIVFTVVFCWTILFPLIGIPIWIVGHRRAQSQLAALERGIAARAELIGVERDPSVKVNGRSPWRIEYIFETQNGQVLDGWVHTWEGRHTRRSAGEVFWVVYLPEDPSQNNVWPPVR